MTRVIDNLEEIFSVLTLTDFIFLGAIVFLIIILSIILFIYRNGEDTLSWADDKTLDDESSELSKIADALEKCNEQLNIDLNVYEIKEEEASIISYEELIKNYQNKKISYSEEAFDGDISIKKIDLETAPIENEKEPYVKPITMSYEKEEALLQALKKLQQNLSGL